MKRARYLLADAFPAPTGRYRIGRRALTPGARQGAPPGPQVDLFYPLEAQAEVVPRATRHPDVAEVDASPAAATGESFPLVMYFSGWPGNAIDNYSLICELVSHGMQVATLIYPEASGDMDYSSETAYLGTVREANRLVNLRAHDAIALLDRLDSRRAALLGFSFGGAVAAEAAVLDERFCAAVNIDGRPWGRALHEGVAASYLFLGGDRPLPSAAALNSSDADQRYNALLDEVDCRELLRNLKRHGGVHVTVSQAEHLDFIDGALRWSVRRWLGIKPADPRRVLHITKSHVGAFLRHAFGMQASPLPLGTAGNFAGVRADVYPRPEQRSAGEARREAAGETRQQQSDPAGV